jgi:transposase
MPDPNEVLTDSRLEKRSRRRFSAAEKKRLLAEADGLEHGEKGAWLRRKGLYAGQLSNWRKELAEHGEAGLAARKPGRKAVDSRDKEIERLKKANARLEAYRKYKRPIFRNPRVSTACPRSLLTRSERQAGQI